MARQSEGDKTGIDSHRQENGTWTTSTSTIAASSCAMPFPVTQRVRARIEGISRRTEAGVISFGLRPMFGVTCRPRAVSTRHGMSGSCTSTCSVSLSLSFSSPFALSVVPLCNSSPRVQGKTDAKRPICYSVNVSEESECNNLKLLRTAPFSVAYLFIKRSILKK